MKMVAMLAALCVLGAASVSADVEKIPIKRVPSAVLAAARSSFRGSSVQEAETFVEDEDGRFYRLSLADKKGVKTTVTARPDGGIVRVQRVLTAKDLPGPVAKALAARFPRATFRDASADWDGDGDRLTYNVNVSQDKLEYAVALRADGSIRQVEKGLPVADLPRPVADAIRAKYPGSTFKGALEKTEGVTVTYDVEVALAKGDSFQMTLDPRGTVLDDEHDD